VRISTKAFGRDRRMPITNQYRGGVRAEERGETRAKDEPGGGAPSVV
jgi:hypothetical protein